MKLFLCVCTACCIACVAAVPFVIGLPDGAPIPPCLECIPLSEPSPLLLLGIGCVLIGMINSFKRKMR